MFKLNDYVDTVFCKHWSKLPVLDHISAAGQQTLNWGKNLFSNWS